MMSFCKVVGCENPAHITYAHRCIKCGKLGHGPVECGNPVLITALLADTTSIPFELQCCALNCDRFSTHTVDYHKCTICNTFGHDGSECPTKAWNDMVESSTTFGRTKDGFMEECDLKLQARNQFGWQEHLVYTKIYGGMGCTWYARRTNIFEKIQLFFMHTDNWGQYGPSTDDRPKLDNFLKGYRCVDKD
jgi:hypothetical protein